MSAANKRLVVYVFLWVLSVGGLYLLQERDADENATFRRAIVENCDTVRTNAQNFRDFINTFQANYRKSTTLTPAEINERVASIEPVKPDVPTCPPLD